MQGHEERIRDDEDLTAYLDIFCTVNLDDILIYNKTREDHVKHVCLVLDRLKEPGLYANIKKCELLASEVKITGIIVGEDGIRTDPDKVKTITDWVSPTCLTNVQAFIAFANFYQRFFEGFFKIIALNGELDEGKRTFVVGSSLSTRV
jgi:hypothetical protein